MGGVNIYDNYKHFFIEIASEMMNNVNILVIIEIGEDEEPDRSYNPYIECLVPHALSFTGYFTTFFWIVEIGRTRGQTKKNKTFQYFFLKVVFIKD